MESLFLNAVDRRVFVKGVGFVSLGIVTGVMMGGCESILDQIANRPVRRRLRTGSADVDADIATYRTGVSLMKNLDTTNPSDPRSWANQAAIHGTISGGFLFCQHSPTLHFFDWHRGYLVYFERIIQKLTGNARFGLPYWNWNQDPAIHPAFLDPSSPLFLARDNTTTAGVWEVSTAALDPILGDTSFFTFADQIEGTPHNTVHGVIGATMGTGGSPLDPIFWAHHNMVDYCWAKWNIELGNNNPNDPTWVNHPNEHLVDADGNPVSVTAGITTLMPLLSYRYESSAIGSNPAAMSAVAETKADYQKLEKRIREGAPVRFDIKQRVVVAEKASMSIGRPFSIQTRALVRDFAAIVSRQSSDRLFISIDYARLPPASDFVVRVFINHPEANRLTPPTDPHFAGSFAFFGTEPATPTGHTHHPHFLINATDAVQRLKESGVLRDDTPISVQLVPVPFAGESKRPDAELVIDQLHLIVTPLIINRGPQ